MKILILSYNDLARDGRLNEIVRVMQHLGEVYTIHATSCGQNADSSHVHAFKNRGMLAYFSFIFYCIRQSKKLGPFDLVVADNRKGIIPAFLNKIVLRIPYSLYDAREFYIYQEMKSISSKLGCLVEKILVPHFDVITCANKYRAQGMQQLYKLKDLPIEFENVRKLEYSDKSEQECAKEFENLFSNKEFINIVTTSGEELIRRADELVDAVARLGNKYRLFLIGYEDKYGQQKIEEICTKRHWHNIIRYKWLSKSQLKYILAHCDIGIVNYSFQNTNNKYCASGKLYEFVFENLPVVTTSNPPLRICEENEIGVVDDSFYGGIQKIISNYSFYKQKVIDFTKSVNVDENSKNVADQISTYLKRSI